MTQYTFPDFKGNDHPQGGPRENLNARHLQWNPQTQQYEVWMPPKKPRIGLAWVGGLLIGGAVGMMIGLAAGGTSAEAPTSITTLPGTQVSTPATGKTTPGTKKVAPKPKVFMAQDGVYLVPENVSPGTYRSGSDATLCIWQRLKDTTGDPEAVITLGSGPNQVVTIKSTDRAFQVTNCGPWVLVK